MVAVLRPRGGEYAIQSSNFFFELIYNSISNETIISHISQKISFSKFD
jgi:hypothetical protein